MGTINQKRLAGMLFCLLVVGMVIYIQPDRKSVPKQRSLDMVFSDIRDWKASGNHPMPEDISKALELDDFLFRTYSKNKENVSLYIGYYYTAKKVGAVHSPLVCYPGQGWEISDAEIKSINVDGHPVHFSSLLTSKGPRKEMILYWFQAFDKTFSGTFAQKLYAWYVRLAHGSESSAFVRVTVPVENGAEEKAYQTGIRFIQSFYPLFHAYVVSPE